MMNDSIGNSFRDEDLHVLLAFVQGRTMSGHRIHSTWSKLVYLDSDRAPNVVATRLNGQISFPRTCSLRVLGLQVDLEAVLEAAKLAGMPYSEKKRRCR